MRYRYECIPLVSSVDTVYHYDLRVTQLNNRNDFPPSLLRRKCIPCFYTPSLCHTSDKNRVCNIASSVCVLLLVPIFLARVQTMSMCPNSHNTTLEAGDAATRNADAWLLPGVVIVITTSSFQSCVRLLHLFMYVRTCRNSINKCTIVMPTPVPWGFFSVTFFVWDKILRQFGNIVLQCCPVFCSFQALQTSSKTNAREYHPKNSKL